MEYTKIKLKSKKMAYALREYFPYTDKPFFKSLDDILDDESLQYNLANLFVQLYKDELVFLFQGIDRHIYICPIKHISKKFTKINHVIAHNIAKLLGIKLIDDYFKTCDIPFVDIRDDYTKENRNVKIEINEKYNKVPTIIFDCCVSTGIIFNTISELINGDSNLYLSYGIRYNSVFLNNTDVVEIINYDFNPDQYMSQDSGYFVRIYGLFGTKDVEVDFRNPFSICIGENGFGKTTAIKLALYALNEYLTKEEICDSLDCDFFDNSVKESKKLSPLSFFYFDKIEIYYSDWYCNDKINKYRYNYDYLKKIGELSSSLICSLNYTEVIPSKEDLIRRIKLKKVKLFFTKISNDEYQKIIRKILLDDRSIEIDYGDLATKYMEAFDFQVIDSKIRNYLNKIKALENNNYIEVKKSLDRDIIFFNCAKSRSIVSKPPRDRVQLDHFEYNYDYDDSYSNYKNEPFELNYDDLDKKMEENCRKHENEENAYYKSYEPSAWDYDNPDDYNPYEDDLGSYYEDIGDYYAEQDNDEDYEGEEAIEKYENNEYFYSQYGCYPNEATNDNDQFLNIFYKNVENVFLSSLSKCSYSNLYVPFIDESSNVEKTLFDSDKVYIHHIFHRIFLNWLNGNSGTSFYSILEQILKIDLSNLTDNYLLLTIDYVENVIKLNLDKLLSKDNKILIEKMYDSVFSENYDIISFGIYDILNKDEFKKLSMIVKKLRVNGIKDDKDYLLVVGIKVLIDSYMSTFISKKNYLLEKLLNKYLVNKHARVYANSLAILDNDDNYIPIDRLSTGERNLIIIFSFCLLNNNKFIILDEPDLSMSVDWQSKILVDLLKYTNNKYMIITQSPLLIQKNNLSIFVKRLDFSEIGKLIDFDLLLKVIKNSNKNNDFSSDNDDLPY